MAGPGLVAPLMSHYRFFADHRPAVAPFVVAAAFYLTGWRTPELASHGELLDPPRHCPWPRPRRAPRQDQPGGADLVNRRWACDEACRQWIVATRQIHVASDQMSGCSTPGSPRERSPTAPPDRLQPTSRRRGWQQCRQTLRPGCGRASGLRGRPQGRIVCAAPPTLPRGHHSRT